jgi:hypothetical protein
MARLVAQLSAPSPHLTSLCLDKLKSYTPPHNVIPSESEIFLQNSEAKVAEKTGWADRISWKSNIASFIAGMLVLAFGFGFMSESTHEKRSTVSMQEVIRPYLARDCAAQVRLLPDYEARKTTLLAKKGDDYGTRQAIPENLVSLPGQRWADDKVAAACAELILSPTPGKSAALRPN